MAMPTRISKSMAKRLAVQKGDTMRGYGPQKSIDPQTIAVLNEFVEAYDDGNIFLAGRIITCNPDIFTNTEHFTIAAIRQEAQAQLDAARAPKCSQS